MDGSKGHVSKIECNHCRDANSSQACGKSFMRNMQAIKSLGEGVADGVPVGERELKVRLGILALV